MSEVTKSDKPVWNANQMKAIEVLAFEGVGKTMQEIADIVGVTRKTIHQWRTIPAFNEAVYNRFMELAEKELPAVVKGQLEKAKTETPAAKLILEHFGKYRPGMDLGFSESPYGLYLKNGGKPTD